MLNIDKKQIKLLCNFVIVFITLFSIFYLMFRHNNSSFYGDDLDYGTYYLGRNTLCGLFNHVGIIHGGGIISLLLTRLTCFTIPLLLGIPPASFICREVGIIQGIFVIILFITYINFLNFSKRVKLLSTIFYSFICVLYFYTLNTTADWIYVNNNNFWRYPFTFIFYNILFLFLYKTTTNNNKKISALNYFFVLLSCIVCAINNEFIIYSVAVIFILFFLYFLLTKFIVKSDKIVQIKLTLMDFYIPAIMFFFSLLWYINTIGYKSIHNYRVPNIDLTAIKNIIYQFSIAFIKLHFIDFIWYWIAFVIIFTACIITAVKKKEISKIIIPLLPVISALIVQYSLIVCSIESAQDSAGNSFWIYRDSLLFSYKMICIIPLFIYSDYIFKNMRIKQNIKLFKSILFSIILILTFFFIKTIHTTNISINFADKQLNYIAEKMLRFYYLRNEIPIIYRNSESSIGGHSSIYNYIHPDRAGNELEITTNNNKIICIKNHYFILNYYSATYCMDHEELKKIGICYSNDAFEKFYEKGGSFTEKELRELKFEKLREDDFVLNRKMTPNNLKDLFNSN